MSFNPSLMDMAIQLAHLSEPSPSAYCVGAVLSKGDIVLATGYSRELPGNTHAEECALIKFGGSCVGADMYTTMEPCSTRTSGRPPCVEHIIRAQIGRVYVGAMEPANFVNCIGVSILQDAGIEVIVVEGFHLRCLEPNSHVLAALNLPVRAFDVANRPAFGVHIACAPAEMTSSSEM